MCSRSHNPTHDGCEPDIQDYAVIGDCRSAALISRHGSIDWLCLPNFDDASWFARLLDGERGGHFEIALADGGTARRRYLDGTNVLESEFENASGTLRVTDLMPLGAPPGQRHRLAPRNEVLRIVEALSGAPEVCISVAPKPDYARRRARARRLGARCIWTDRNEILTLSTDAPAERLTLDGDRLRGRFTLRAGARAVISLVYEKGNPAVMPGLGKRADERLALTCAAWREWSERNTYDGPYAAAVGRSALVLRLLTSSLSGSVLAAATTSLPEWIGAGRNWDYRYCWLRDAAFTLSAYARLGYRREVARFVDWLLHATRLTRPNLRVMYDLFGRPPRQEIVLDHLRGYRGSQPVRVGNDAFHQYQLDIYGTVICAIYEYIQHGGHLDTAGRRSLRRFGEAVCDQWRNADNGIWEVRSERRHNTHSKLMCWAALDRLIRLADAGHLKLDRKRFAENREAVRREIDDRAFHEERGCYTGHFDGEQLDAAVLLLANYGFRDADDPRVKATFEAIERELARGAGVYRYPFGYDGMDLPEGTFGICSFWRVSNLAQRGEIERARELFESLLGRANDLGLYSEEFDPDGGFSLGNFPQALTHVGLIQAATALDAAENRRRDGEKP